MTLRQWTALLLALCLAGARPAGAASSAEERELGRKFALEGRARFPFIDEVEVVSYVDRIGRKIVAALGDQPFQYEFAVVRDPRINAFAVPGGFVYVHGGLLVRAGNDSELAGVLGHEIAHVNAHHLVRQQEATRLLNYAAILGLLLSVVQPAIGAGAMAANAAAQLQYQREFEQEADYLGARYMRQAGYDPRGILDFFKKMSDEQRVTPTFAPPYLLSHPLSDTRLNNLEAVLGTHQWERGKGDRAGPSLELERVQLLVRARSEQPQDVLTVYHRRAAAAPADGRSRYLLGLAYLETGAFENARTTFEAARQAGFRDVDREMGRTLFRLQEPRPALELLRHAVEANPEDAAAHLELARVLAATNDSAAAMRAYERVLALAPSCEEAHYGFAMIAGRNGRETDAFYHLGIAYGLRGEYEKGLTQLEKAKTLLPATDPRAAEVHDRIAEWNDFLGRPGAKKPK